MIKKMLATLGFLGLPFSAGAAVINLDVYQILQSSIGDPYPEFVELTFFNPKPAGVPGRLRITAEGVDLSENDEVRLNGSLLGTLTHQTYNYCCFDIQAGPGGARCRDNRKSRFLLRRVCPASAGSEHAAHRH